MVVRHFLIIALSASLLDGCQLTQKTPAQRKAYQMEQHCRDVGKIAAAQMKAIQKPTLSVGKAVADGYARSSASKVAYRECMWQKGYEPR